MGKKLQVMIRCTLVPLLVATLKRCHVPSLIRPQIFGATSSNVFCFSLSPKATSLMWPQSLATQGGFIREGLLYTKNTTKLYKDKFSMFTWGTKTYFEEWNFRSLCRELILVFKVIVSQLDSTIWTSLGGGGCILPVILINKNKKPGDMYIYTVKIMVF